MLIPNLQVSKQADECTTFADDFPSETNFPSVLRMEAQNIVGNLLVVQNTVPSFAYVVEDVIN